MENIREKLTAIIEQAGSETPKCQNCVSYKQGGCTFGCVNERRRLTSPNYSCENYCGVYNFDHETLDILNDMLRMANKVDESAKNLELLLTGKISESEFKDIER